MAIINLTPHPVVVLRDDPNGTIAGFTGVGNKATEGKFSLVAEFPPTGSVARAAQRDIQVRDLDVNGTPVPLVRTEFGQPTDLPEPTAETLLVVSIITANAAKVAGRDTGDLLITSDPVRDAAGKFIGVRKFALI